MDGSIVARACLLLGLSIALSGCEEEAVVPRPTGVYDLVRLNGQPVPTAWGSRGPYIVVSQTLSLDPEGGYVRFSRWVSVSRDTGVPDEYPSTEQGTTWRIDDGWWEMIPSCPPTIDCLSSGRLRPTGSGVEVETESGDRWVYEPR